MSTGCCSSRFCMATLPAPSRRASWSGAPTTTSPAANDIAGRFLCADQPPTTARSPLGRPLSPPPPRLASCSSRRSPSAPRLAWSGSAGSRSTERSSARARRSASCLQGDELRYKAMSYEWRSAGASKRRRGRAGDRRRRPDGLNRRLAPAQAHDHPAGREHRSRRLRARARGAASGPAYVSVDNVRPVGSGPPTRSSPASASGTRARPSRPSGRIPETPDTEAANGA